MEILADYDPGHPARWIPRPFNVNPILIWGTAMNTRHLLPSAILLLAGWSMPLAPARADVVQADSVGFIKGGFIKGGSSKGSQLAPAQANVVLTESVGFIRGTQIFTDTFDIATPGVLTVSLSTVPWLDTLQDLNCFVSSPTGGVLAGSFNGGTEAIKVRPGDITVNWYGTAAGTFGVGVYALQVDLQPTAPVPTPASLPLLLSGLGVLWGLKRSRRPAPPVC
jgi:hypothetical protein